MTTDVDPVTATNRTFIFNGDNKQSEVKDANGNPIGQYFYDGEGKRVKKVIPATGETTVFVYSSGKLIAEYSTQTNLNPTVGYTTTDHLGSPRIITDQFGQVTSRRDFMPFGEEIDAGIGARSAAISYGSAADSLRQKFTGYQKDEETSLDFAEARMYENRYGRFTAVDPLLASGKSANPQTFNRYAYVLGNPLSMTDPLGLDPWWKGNCKDGRCSYLEAKEKPTDGTWESVTFNDRGYATVGEWNTTGKTAYLYAGGGQDFGSIARFSDAMVESERQANSWNDPKLLAIRHPEVAEQGGAVMAMGVPFLNLVPGTYNLGAWGANKFGANLPYAPTLEPDENTPGLAKGFYYGANIALLAQSGVSAYRSFAAPVGKTVFWAGFPEARNAATSFSAITDGQTIEMTTGGRVLSTFSPTLRTISSRADDFLWARASSAFARQATGNVNVFMRLPVNTARTTWAKVEEPILKARGINITPFFVKQ